VGLNIGSSVFTISAMLKLFLWLRYLRKKKIVFLSITAVALSVSLLIVVSSLFTGFIKAFQRAAVEAIGDVVLAPLTKFAKYDLFIEHLEQTEVVEAATAVLSAQGLLHLGKGNVRAVDVLGIEPVRRTKVMDFDHFLLRQKDSGGALSFQESAAEGGVGGFVGIGVVAEPDEKTDKYDFDAVEKMFGQEVVLTTGTISQADKEGRRVEFKRQVMKFTIADVVETGVYQFDNGCVYLPLEELQKTLYPNEPLPVASEVQIKLADNADPDAALAVIRGVWRSFVGEHLGADLYLMQYTRIETSKQMQRRYVAAYRKQMGLLLLIFGVVSFGVILLVFCIFYMIVRLKQKDIAIIKSCGAAGSSVAWIFVGFGVCVGIVGSAIGAVLGYIVTKNINTIEDWIRIIFGLKLWKSSVYMFNKIPNEVDWASALPIVLFAIIAAAIGTLIPAVVAAWTKPVEILRYE
jgi:lipoprotein-releasing system permease protein